MRARAPAWFDRLRTRVMFMIARAVVRSANDEPLLQELALEVLKGRHVLKAERFQNYGLSSVPLSSAEAVVVFARGDWGQPMVIAVDDRACRPNGLAAGEVVLYDAAGTRVHLKNDGTIKISASVKVEIEAPAIEAKGSDSVRLESGASSIEISPAGVTVTAPKWDLNQA